MIRPMLEYVYYYGNDEVFSVEAASLEVADEIFAIMTGGEPEHYDVQVGGKILPRFCRDSA